MPRSDGNDHPRVVALLFVAAVVVAACSPSGTTTGKAPAASQTRTVQVDGAADGYNGAFLAYFPNAVTVSPGDAVRFAENWTGEPHTVTMGSLVDSALPPANATAAQTQPAFQRLPVLLPNGPGNAHQNAAQPCFL